MDIMDRQRSNERFKRPELLAPAGDLARAKAAIRYGADAVYLGGMRYSLRSRASNFTIEDIQEICHYAKEHGAAVHVTVNIIPHNEDFEGLAVYLKQLEEAGVEAIIVASPAIMSLARQAAPNLKIHCSTQMSVTNVEAAKFLKEKLDIDRVVLARECTISEVKEITANCPIETEAFIHGGMCVNYSGRCTLSNRMTLRDANRGGCAQSCRWKYRLYRDHELLREDFTMGSKDLAAVDYIYDLMASGVSSFKIEGRMKTEYYVACVVNTYRHMIDEILEKQSPLTFERQNAYKKEILKAMNRETWSGFYSGEKGRNSLILHQNNNNDVNHDFLGICEFYQNGKAYFRSRNVFMIDETIEVLSPGLENRTFQVSAIENEEGSLIKESRKPMVLVAVPVPFEVNPHDILRRYRP